MKRTIMTIAGLIKARKILKKYNANPFTTKFEVIQAMTQEDKIAFIVCFNPKMRWEMCKKMWGGVSHIPIKEIIAKAQEKEGTLKCRVPVLPH